MRWTAVFGVLVMLAPLAAWGQGAPEPVDPVAAELAKLNRTLREIAELLKKQEAAQGVDLMMRRLQLAEARLMESERALKSADSERGALEVERGQLEMATSLIETRLAKGGEDADTMEAEAARVEGDLRRLRQRLGQIHAEIGRLEGEVAARRDDVRTWQAALDRRLSAH